MLELLHPHTSRNKFSSSHCFTRCYSVFEEFNVVPLFSCVFEQAEKNVYLEERVQVLQQQNEDLKERIDKNLAVSRSVSLTFICSGNYPAQLHRSLPRY